MQHRERKLTASDGVELHLDTWSGDGAAKFVVAISHGGAEHAGRYARLAGDLVEAGGFVFGLDHRGQGRSGGTRGHVDRFETYAHDLRHALLDVAGQGPGTLRPEALPWFLFGHSMGGLIALVYLLDHESDVPLRGAIVSSPLLGLTMKVNPVKLTIGKIAGRIAPKLALPTGIPPEGICRDPEEVQRYIADTRRADVVTAGWFAAMNAAIARVENEAAKITIPSLWYVGSGDRICDHEATKRVFATMKDAEARDQTLREFDGYYHELHNEPDEYRRPVIEMLRDWITARLHRG
ncbi:MAG TPA: alpha/beta hydrolase [Nannocystaceae bacterium]|nr:alpha/beta hydrolase [Nannocystaceae bacterium]